MKCGYEFQAKPASRFKIDSNGNYIKLSCKHCAGKVSLPGVSDIGSLSPALAEEYVEALNSIPLESMRLHSNKLVNWRCRICDQIFKSTPNSRNRKDGAGGCPYCAGKLPIKGVNDFATIHPELLSEFDYDKNRRTPDNYTEFSPQSVWWICSKNHHWKSSFQSRSNGYGKCPECTRVPDGLSLKKLHPELIEYYDYDKNGKGPEYYTEFSNEKVYFKCENGHSFKYPIYRFTQKGFYCPICENIMLVSGTNDLATCYPILAKEYDLVKNAILPEEMPINYGSNVWWVCPEKNHSYEMPVRNRINDRLNCPICKNVRVLKGDNDAETHYPKITNVWDFQKNERKPDEIAYTSDVVFNYICPSEHQWSESLQSLIRNDYHCPICDNKRVLPGYNSLDIKHPELLREWDPDNVYAPSHLLHTLKVRIGWICNECGMKYNAPLNEKISGESDCPYCNGDKAIPGKTSFKALYPQYAELFSKENDINPDTILPKSSLYYAWCCGKCGMGWSSRIDYIITHSGCHCNGERAIPGKTSFKALYPQYAELFSDENKNNPDTILPKSSLYYVWYCSECGMGWNSRIDYVIDHSGCPYCNGERAIPGKTSFKALYPQYVELFSKENENNPDTILPKSSLYHTWYCGECGMGWSSRIDYVINHSGCPYCNGERAIPGKTSFKSLYPELMEEWKIISNTLLGIDPDLILPSNSIATWWKCSFCATSYKMNVKKKILYQRRGKRACPYCNGYRRNKKRIL